MRESPANRLEPHWPPDAARAQHTEAEPKTWKEAAQSWEGDVKSFLSEHPKLVIIAAATAGLVLGWIVKRR